MNKSLLIILCFFIFPLCVFAEETCENIELDEFCKSSNSTCLSSLQNNYNKWETSNNTGVVCIKVIAQVKGNERSYFSGRNPETDYKCSSGATVNAKIVSSAISSGVDNPECTNEICYVPEIWKMDCENTDSSIPLNSTVNNESDNSLNEEVSTNSEGQITGTTDTSDTGVETYFFVLAFMILLSYLLLSISKKKTLFKNI